MPFGQDVPITDICIIAEDIDRTVAFYVDRLGFRLRRRAEGFADFHGAGLTLAAWTREHIHRTAGVSGVRAPAEAHKACIAVRLEDAADVDRWHDELAGKGVPFYRPPADYPWNARCAYFQDPDGTLWELYAWIGAGPDAYHDEHP